MAKANKRKHKTWSNRDGKREKKRDPFLGRENDKKVQDLILHCVGQCKFVSCLLNINRDNEFRKIKQAANTDKFSPYNHLNTQ